MAVGDNFRLAFSGSLFTQSIVTVMHYEQQTANTTADTDVKQLAKAWDDAIVTDYVKACSQDAAWGMIEARSFPVPPTPMVGFDLAVVQAGLEASPSMPNAVTVVLRKKTGFLGRAYRGRVYMPAVPQSFITDGLVNGAGQTAYNNAMAVLVAGIQSADAGAPKFVPMIMAYTRDVDGNITGVRKNPVTTMVLDKIFRSQRRREIGVGA